MFARGRVLVVFFSFIALCYVAYIFYLHFVNKGGLFRSTVRHTQPNCKVKFTKLTNFTFFFKNICTYQKKAVPLHQISKRKSKHINKLKNFTIMEKAIKLLKLVDENNFLKVYFVISKPAKDVFAIESIGFTTREEAQAQCDYMNKENNTNIYKVFETSMHI